MLLRFVYLPVLLNFFSLRQGEYRQKLESLTVDSEGRPFRMLVFRGSPKSSRKLNYLIDEMRKDDAEALYERKKQCQTRHLPKVCILVLTSWLLFV